MTQLAPVDMTSIHNKLWNNKSMDSKKAILQQYAEDIIKKERQAKKDAKEQALTTENDRPDINDTMSGREKDEVVLTWIENRIAHINKSLQRDELKLARDLIEIAAESLTNEGAMNLYNSIYDKSCKASAPAVLHYYQYLIKKSQFHELMKECPTLSNKASHGTYDMIISSLNSVGNEIKAQEDRTKLKLSDPIYSNHKTKAYELIAKNIAQLTSEDAKKLHDELEKQTEPPADKRPGGLWAFLRKNTGTYLFDYGNTDTFKNMKVLLENKIKENYNPKYKS
jgi:hypothetical protein